MTDEWSPYLLYYIVVKNEWYQPLRQKTQRTKRTIMLSQKHQNHQRTQKLVIFRSHRSRTSPINVQTKQGIQPRNRQSPQKSGRKSGVHKKPVQKVSGEGKPKQIIEETKSGFRSSKKFIRKRQQSNHSNQTSQRKVTFEHRNDKQLKDPRLTVKVPRRRPSPAVIQPLQVQSLKEQITGFRLISRLQETTVKITSLKQLLLKTNERIATRPDGRHPQQPHKMHERHLPSKKTSPVNHVNSHDLIHPSCSIL